MKKLESSQKVQEKEIEQKIRENTEDIQFRAKIIEESKDLDKNQRFALYNKLLDSKNPTAGPQNPPQIYPVSNQITNYPDAVQGYYPNPPYIQPQPSYNPYMPGYIQNYPYMFNPYLQSQPINQMMMVTSGQTNNNINNQYMFPQGSNPNPNGIAPQNMMYAKPMDNNITANPYPPQNNQNVSNNIQPQMYQQQQNNNNQDHLSKSYQGPPSS